MQTSVSRAVPASLAALLSELELERPAVVTADMVETLRRRIGVEIEAGEIVRRLRRLGWFLPLRVRGAWEFAPGDRAGPMSGGDPFIEVRALHQVNPQLRIGVGYESAAFLRSLASRQPSREVLIFDEGTPTVRALSDFRRVELTLPDTLFKDLSGLRVQTALGLLLAIAIRPDGFRDWPGLAEWLPALAADVDHRITCDVLTGRSPSAWARAAYLLRAGGNGAAAGVLSRQAPTGKGPFYLGPRRPGGHFDASTQVIDTVIRRYSSAGQER